MTDTKSQVKSIAPLTNVSLAASAMDEIVNRIDELPGVACLYGYSGQGKSKAASYVATKYRAYYVEGLSVWTRKDYLKYILEDMGIKPVGSISELMHKAGEQLTQSRRPLIIDQADYLVDKANGCALIMDLHQASKKGKIMLIGEENLNHKILKQHPQLHNRVLVWERSQPADLNDCRQLNQFYSPDVEIAANLLAHVNDTVSGCTRLVVVNINKIRRAAQAEGRTDADIVWWADRPLYTGTK